jgi:hypothetical protein
MNEVSTPNLIVQSNIHEEAMHVGAKQIGTNQVSEIQLFQFISSDELVIFINCRADLTLFKLFSHIVKKRAPPDQNERNENNNESKLNSRL